MSLHKRKLILAASRAWLSTVISRDFLVQHGELVKNSDDGPTQVLFPHSVSKAHAERKYMHRCGPEYIG